MQFQENKSFLSKIVILLGLLMLVFGLPNDEIGEMS